MTVRIRKTKKRRSRAPEWMPYRVPIDGSPPACILHTGLTLRETVETPGALEDLAAQLSTEKA